MFLSPLVAVLLIGSFWTGVGATAAANGGFDHHNRSDIAISATTTDHDDACSARYRSYDPETGKYMSSRDHRWHDCQL